MSSPRVLWTRIRYMRSISLRVVWVLGLNAAVGLCIAISVWWLQSRTDLHLLPTHLADSLIHSVVYGTMFGFTMPYLAERFGFLRFPWNWITIFASLAVVALVATAAIQLLLLRAARISSERFWPEFGYKSGTVFLVALIIAMSVWGYERFRDQIDATNLQLRTQQLEKERALKLLTEARLSALESRLQPHFLFNTLNNISALISENPTLAEEMIQRLATLLRVSLDAHTGRHVALGDEIRLARDYVEIEKIRLGERLSLTITIPPELERLIVPPMTLQPLIENSIKYAISPRIGGGQITVSAQQENGLLSLSVWDDGPGFAKEQIATGHSIDNLRARLKDMFGNEAKICVSCENGGAEVRVSLPAKTSSTTYDG